jgi:hypothetical protein
MDLSFKYLWHHLEFGILFSRTFWYTEETCWRRTGAITSITTPLLGEAKESSGAL